MHSGQMDAHAVLAAELLPAVLARVHKRVGEVDTLNVLHHVVPARGARYVTLTNYQHSNEYTKKLHSNE